MKVMLVAGARPNFMKIAPVLRQLERAGHTAVLVHTEQHYDEQMSGAFFNDLWIREPDHCLGVGSGSHAQQTARVMERFEPIVESEQPDWVLVPGDVNSTLAAALVTAKLRPLIGCRLAHLEAGLRSFDWRMPEELNRVLTDRCADLLLTPSRDAHGNLEREGIPAERVVFVGNLMVDSLLERLPAARARNAAAAFDLVPGHYAVATLHRPSNVDDERALRTCMAGLGAVAEELPLLLPVHPRTGQQIAAAGLAAELGCLHLTPPLGYVDMLSLVDGAAVVITDSGGLQEETTALGVPCVTLREQTERPITVTMGTNRLAPWPLTAAGILASFRAARSEGRSPPGSRSPEGWDGHSAARVVAALEN
ncbi:MAG: UDP-N-acetylglucosamine 2-epimerase (non-hydrolyzing) [Gemmatimonadetes bacterium]|nr:UDP-N-acetylglucosamine 2-epimerase (non-hydrolyzing) [Gemmatimonadota bacterium]